MIWGYCIESLFGCFDNPVGRCKVHVALPKVDAIRREIGGTASNTCV